LNRRQREVFVEKLPDTGNLALGGLVLPFRRPGVLGLAGRPLGVVAWGLSMGSAALAKKEE
jgi:hypothetical protein